MYFIYKGSKVQTTLEWLLWKTKVLSILSFDNLSYKLYLSRKFFHKKVVLRLTQVRKEIAVGKDGLFSVPPSGKLSPGLASKHRSLLEHLFPVSLLMKGVGRLIKGSTRELERIRLWKGWVTCHKHLGLWFSHRTQPGRVKGRRACSEQGATSHRSPTWSRPQRQSPSPVLSLACPWDSPTLDQQKSDWTKRKPQPGRGGGDEEDDGDGDSLI